MEMDHELTVAKKKCKELTESNQKLNNELSELRVTYFFTQFFNNIFFSNFLELLSA